MTRNNHAIRSSVRPAAMAFGVVLMVGIPRQAAAQDMGDAVAGRQLAEMWCSNCHVVGPTQARGTSNGAPTFAAIAGMKSITQLSLRVFFQAPHDRMPDLHMSRDEVDNVSAYILSLRHDVPASK